MQPLQLKHCAEGKLRLRECRPARRAGNETKVRGHVTQAVGECALPDGSRECKSEADARADEITQRLPPGQSEGKRRNECKCVDREGDETQSRGDDRESREEDCGDRKDRCQDVENPAVLVDEGDDRFERGDYDGHPEFDYSVPDCGEMVPQSVVEPRGLHGRDDGAHGNQRGGIPFLVGGCRLLVRDIDVVLSVFCLFAPVPILLDHLELFGTRCLRQLAVVVAVVRGVVKIGTAASSARHRAFVLPLCFL